VLGHESKRKEYDEVRAAYRGGGFHFPGGGGGSTTGPVNLGDIFGNGNLGDLFGGIFNRGGGGTTTTGTRRAARRGADVETEVSISFDDALDGVTLPVNLIGEGPCPTCHGTGAKAGTTPRVCAKCEGTGQVVRNQGGFAIPEVCPECRGRGLTVEDPCPQCKGSGRAASNRVVQARIPAGVKDGQRVRLPGKGAAGENGGPAGDLHIRVNVAQHPVFARSEDNLTVTVPVTFTEAALGGEIQVPAPGGGTPVKVKIPAGTKNGRTFRVQGRGVRRRDGTVGDLLVTVEVAVPGKLSGKATEALKAYQEATADHDPRADLLQLAAQTARRPRG
jgi:molecular chaperone DnaJ